MPRCKAWVSYCLFVVQVFPGPKEWDSSNRYPAFFMVCSEKVEMFHSVFGYLAEKWEFAENPIKE